MGQVIWNFIKKIDEIVGMALMAFIVLLACANVFMRYVIGAPWGWVEEVTIFTFVWLTMIGAASVIKVEGHCSIDVLVRRLPPKYERTATIAADICVIITLLLMIWYGWELSMGAADKVTPMLGIPYTYVDLSIPVASVFMLVYYLKLTWLDITGKRKKCDLGE